MKSNTDTLKKLLDRLDWPAIYPFKFIVPVDKLDAALALFKKQETTIRLSGKGNYASVSATPFMMNSDKVLEKYQEAARIKGLVAL